MSKPYLPFVIKEVNICDILKLERCSLNRVNVISLEDKVKCIVDAKEYVNTPSIVFDKNGNIISLLGLYAKYDKNFNTLKVYDLEFNEVYVVKGVLDVIKVHENTLLLLSCEKAEVLILDVSVGSITFNINSKWRLIKTACNGKYLSLLFEDKYQDTRYCFVIDINRKQLICTIRSRLIDVSCSNDSIYICYTKGKRLILMDIEQKIEVKLSLKPVKFIELKSIHEHLVLEIIYGDKERTIIFKCKGLSKVLEINRRRIALIYQSGDDLFLWDSVTGILFLYSKGNKIPLIQCNEEPLIIEIEGKLYMICNNYVYEVSKYVWKPLMEVNKALIHRNYIINIDGRSIEVYDRYTCSLKFVLRATKSFTIADNILIACYNNRIFFFDLNRRVDSSSILIEDLHESQKPVLVHMFIRVPQGLIVDSISIPNAYYIVSKSNNGFEVLVRDIKSFNIENLITRKIEQLGLRLLISIPYNVNEQIEFEINVHLKKPIAIINSTPRLIFCPGSSIEVEGRHFTNALLTVELYAFNPLPRPLSVLIGLEHKSNKIYVEDVTVKPHFSGVIKVNSQIRVLDVINCGSIKVFIKSVEPVKAVIDKRSINILRYETPISNVKLIKGPILVDAYSAVYKIQVGLSRIVDEVFIYAEGSLQGKYKFYLKEGVHELIVRFTPKPYEEEATLNVKCIEYLNGLKVTWSSSIKLGGNKGEIKLKVLKTMFKDDDVSQGCIAIPIYLNDPLKTGGFITLTDIELKRIIISTRIVDGVNVIKVKVMPFRRVIPIMIDYFNGIICIRKVMLLRVVDIPLRRSEVLINEYSGSLRLLLNLESTSDNVYLITYEVNSNKAMLCRLKKGLNFIDIGGADNINYIKLIIHISYEGLVWEKCIEGFITINKLVYLAYVRAIKLSKILDDYVGRGSSTSFN